MKTKRGNLLFIVLTLVVITSLISCVPSYNQQDLDEARVEGRLEGFDEGKKAGFAELESAKQEAEKIGYDKGYTLGKKEGYAEGYDTGYDEGYITGLARISALPTITPPEEIATPPLTQPEEEQVIEDLAYIRAYNLPYSDDADPEWEGISIRVNYYNSKSKLIIPHGVTVEVTIELYWYTNFLPIYQEEVIINYTGALTDLTREVIRIPFKGIQERPAGCTRNPILDVIVATPAQGDFEDCGGKLTYWP